MLENQRVIHLSLLREVVEALNDGSHKNNTLKSEIQSIIDDELNVTEAIKSLKPKPKKPVPPEKPIIPIVRNEKVLNKDEIDSQFNRH